MSEIGKLRVSTTPDTACPVRYELSQLWQVALNVHTLVKNTHHVNSDIKSQVEDQMFASRVDAETLVKIVPRLALARVTRQLCERALQIAEIMA